MKPLSHDAFQQVMNRPSTMDDVFFGPIIPNNDHYYWQPHMYPRGAYDMGNGGRSAAASRTVSPGPDIIEDYIHASAFESGSEFDGQPGSSPAFGQGP